MTHDLIHVAGRMARCGGNRGTRFAKKLRERGIAR